MLLFPSDDFNQDYPSTDLAFVQKAGLPANGGGCTLMSKVKLNGPETAEVFQYAKKIYPGDIGWNFDGGYLFNPDGSGRAKFSLRGDANIGYAELQIRQALRRG